MGKWIKEKDLAEYAQITSEEITQDLAIALAQTKRNIEVFDEHARASAVSGEEGNISESSQKYENFPGASSDQNIYTAGPNRNWTTGFWTGEVWLSYENTTDMAERALFLKTASAHVQSFLQRIETLTEVDHHDMGFLYSPSCVAAYLLTGSEEGKRAAILAADNLCRRFHEVGEFLQAWGAMDDPNNYRFIIDCLLNLPLLYWASETTGDQKYREIAEKHIHTAMKYVIREDDSTWHTVFLNPETGLFDYGATCQGYKDGSAWARGQAWGIYGSAVAYKYTGRDEYKGYFKRVTTYFLEHLPKDLVPYWDLTFGDGDESEPRDSSSAAIAACGMLEMAKYLDADGRVYYTAIAKKLLKAVHDQCVITEVLDGQGLVKHGTYSHKSPYNTCNPEGTDECVIWGDYYYFEALHRLSVAGWRGYF